jgi:hypothetical protein
MQALEPSGKKQIHKVLIETLSADLSGCLPQLGLDVLKPALQSLGRAQPAMTSSALKSPSRLLNLI